MDVLSCGFVELYIGGDDELWCCGVVDLCI